MKIDIILEAGLPAGRVEALGQLAERYGIQTLWVASFPSRRDPIPALALLARCTTRLRLGTLPMSPWEVHPLRIADQLLTLNELSGGRATILIGGLGHSVSRVTGLEPVRRVTAVRDTLRILKGLRHDAMLNYEGELYTLKNYQAEWATQPPPRVYAGATFHKMLRMAAGVADGTMMSDVPLQRMPEVMGWAGEGLAKAGRQRADFRMNNFMAWHVKEDRAAAIAEARRELIWRGLLMAWFTELFLDPADAAMVEEKRPAFLQAFLQRSPRIEGVPEPVIDKLVENMTLAGDPADLDRIVRHLKALEAAGLDEVALRLHDDPEEALAIIGQRLVPEVS
ncbi:MAG: LLM class flavin-dependent oxidoreductase [Chromatiales bacterium]|nr:LLM class flavin-dependent oxidoreductase [Chromatiales bacterium]